MMNETRAYWREQLLSAVPPETDVLARNRAITSCYASWYLAHPALYKWPGMAVFASVQVGEFLQISHGQKTRGRALATRLFGASFELVRQTNNEVFEDIGWALLAFVSPGGGLKAVEEGLSDLGDSHALLIQAFRHLESGRQRGDASLLWEAARCMLQHEQRFSVQPRFASFPGAFRWWLSMSAAGAFPVPGMKTKRRFFFPFMLKRRIARPDLTVFEQRWSWINAEVFDLWRELEQSRPAPLLAYLQQQREL